jgi:hypothetical protein
MLHLLYILAFTVIAFLAIGNLIRSMVLIGAESQGNFTGNQNRPKRSSRYGHVPHPELLDDTGNLSDEPLLIMKSLTLDDAREQLDALYRSSPSAPSDQGDAA